MQRRHVVLICGSLALVALLAWTLRRQVSALFGLDGRDASTSEAVAPDAAGPVAPPTYLEGGAAKAEEAAGIPDSVDLARVDRELDLHGIVVTREGRAIAGARLRAVTYPWRRADLLDVEAHDEAADGPTTRSARDGTFTLRLPRGQRVELRASAEGYADCERRGCVAGQRIRLVMTPGAACVVVLKDESGAAVPGTPVHLFRTEYLGDLVFERRATTGPDGRARFDGLPGGVKAWIEPEPVLLGGVAWKQVEIPSAGDVVVEVVLPRGRTVRGRVTDAVSGAAIAGARVGINWVLDRAVRTDAEGRYEVPGWNEQQGADDLHVEAEGYGRQSTVVGKREVVDFALERGDSVKGRVLDGARRPLPGVRVGCIPIGPASGTLSPDINRGGVTDGAGRFLLTSLRRDQRHALVFLAPGLGRTHLDFAPRPGGPGVVDVGDVVLVEGRRIEGRVLSAGGSPVPDVAVVLRGSNADRRRLLPAGEAAPGGVEDSGATYSYGEEQTAYSDDLGRFRFADLSPGAYQLSAISPGREGAERSVALDLGADALDADLVFAEGREIVVRVLDGQARPLPGVYVNARSDGTGGALLAGGQVGFVVGGQTDEKGELHLVLPPGQASLEVLWVREFDPQSRRFLTQFRKVIDDDLREIVLSLEEADVVAGVVRDAAGAPLPGTRVFAARAGEAAGFAVSDDKGRFAIEVPRGARVDLRAGPREALERGEPPVPYTGAVLGVEAGRTDVVLVARPVPRDRALTVLVLSPDGRPVAGARVLLASWGVNDQILPTDDRGRAEFTDLFAQAYRGTADPGPARSGEWLSAAIAPVEAEGQEIVVRLRAGAVVSGTVVDRAGRPVPIARVAVLEADSVQAAAEGTADEAGQFRLLVDPLLRAPVRVRVARGPGDRLEDWPVLLELSSVPATGLILRLE